MGFQIMGTAHLRPREVFTARCVCTEDSTRGCPFHCEVVRVLPKE